MTTPEEVRTITLDDELPTLVIGYPACSHCGSDVEIEDGVAWCTNCRVQWSRIEDGVRSTPDPNREGTEVACEIEHHAPAEAPYDHAGKRWESGARGPCILPSGHEGEHIHPYQVTITPLNAEASR